MTPTSVTVAVRHTRRGAVLLEYANDLAVALGVPLCAEHGTPSETLSPANGSEGTILVDEGQSRHDITTVVPFEEREVKRVSLGNGEAMIPLGNGESGLFAARSALRILRTLNMNVVFYHTTWRSPKLPPEASPMCHACPEVFDVIRRAEYMAREERVASRTVIETADGIVDGALLRALTDRCALIVVARGRNTGKGAYVDQWLAKSPVPIMVMGRSQEVAR